MQFFIFVFSITKYKYMYSLDVNPTPYKWTILIIQDNMETFNRRYKSDYYYFLGI